MWYYINTCGWAYLRICPILWTSLLQCHSTSASLLNWSSGTKWVWGCREDNGRDYQNQQGIKKKIKKIVTLFIIFDCSVDRLIDLMGFPHSEIHTTAASSYCATTSCSGSEVATEENFLWSVRRLESFCSFWILHCIFVSPEKLLFFKDCFLHRKKVFKKAITKLLN